MAFASAAAVLAVLFGGPDRRLPTQEAPSAAVIDRSGAATQPTLATVQDRPASPPAYQATDEEPLDALPPLPPLPPLPAERAPSPHGSSRPEPAGAATAAPEAAAVRHPADEGVLRVFIHLADPARQSTAERLRTDLEGAVIGDQRVATPPIRVVARAPRRTEVRCLKQADCPAARRLARTLEQNLGVPVAVLDMSRTYERDPRIRPGSLEVWLSSGDS